MVGIQAGGFGNKSAGIFVVVSLCHGNLFGGAAKACDMESGAQSVVSVNNYAGGYIDRLSHDPSDRPITILDAGKYRSDKNSRPTLRNRLHIAGIFLFFVPM